MMAGVVKRQERVKTPFSVKVPRKRSEYTHSSGQKIEDNGSVNYIKMSLHALFMASLFFSLNMF